LATASKGVVEAGDEPCGAAGIGARIRERRSALGLSLRDLSLPGVSAGYVSRIERGERTPSTKALRLLARRLDVTVHWLETGVRDPTERLAQLVLTNKGRPLPPSANALARSVLARLGAPRVSSSTEGCGDITRARCSQSEKPKRTPACTRAT